MDRPHPGDETSPFPPFLATQGETSQIHTGLHETFINPPIALFWCSRTWWENRGRGHPSSIPGTASNYSAFWHLMSRYYIPYTNTLFSIYEREMGFTRYGLFIFRLTLQISKGVPTTTWNHIGGTDMGQMEHSGNHIPWLWHPRKAYSSGMDKSLLVTHLSFVRNILERRTAGKDPPAVSILGSILYRQQTISRNMCTENNSYSDGNYWLGFHV